MAVTVEQVTALLERWLGAPPRDVEQIHGGMETSVWAFGESVLRLYGGAAELGKAQNEYQALKGLHRVGYPVPKVHGFDPEGPFIIMERVPGGTLSHTDIRAFTDLLVRLHRLDPEAVWPGRPAEPILAQAEALLQPHVEAAPLLAWFRAQAPSVAPGPAGVLHGDFHPGNVLRRPDGALVVIDWSGCRVGDPRLDLGWSLVLAPFMGVDPTALVECYQELRGEAVRDLSFFEALALGRMLGYLLAQPLPELADMIGALVDRVQKLTGIALSVGKFSL